MIVHLYSDFRKRENSTALPWADADKTLIAPGEVVQGEAFGPLSLASPTISFYFEGSFSPRYNYAFVEDLYRYYFINDWVYDNGLWYAHMNVDALGSYRHSVGESMQYVLRSSYQYDGFVTDTMYPALCDTVEISTTNTSENFGWTGNAEAGSYVVGIVNSDVEARGVVSYYVFTPSEFRNLCELMLGDPAYLDITIDELSNGLQKALVNPFQYIVSAMWFPFIASHGDRVTEIKIGWWTFNVSCLGRIVQHGYSAHSLRFAIPKHPQAASRGEYLNYSPFSGYSMFVPGFGEFDIPPANLDRAEYINAQLITDLVTGKSTMQLFNSGEGSWPIAYREAQVGVPIQIGGISTGGAGIWPFASGLAHAAADSGFAQTFGLDEFFRTAGVASSAIAGSMVGFSSGGANGTISSYYFPTQLRGVFVRVADDDNANNGRPLCQVRKISTIPGFIVCRNPDFDGYATQIEQEKIKSYMRSGFFYE